MNFRAINDPETEARAMRLRRMMQGFFANQTPQERDCMTQLHLAQARGPVRNGDLLRAGVARAVRQVADREGRVITVEDPLIDTLSTIVAAFGKLDIQYAVAGSLAASIHCEPVSSREVEFLIDASSDQVIALLSRVSPRFLGNAVDIVDIQTSLSVSLSFVRENRFRAQVLKRRLTMQIGSDLSAFYVVTPEDIILMKLLWRKDTRSAKQWENAMSVARFKGARMDWKYLFEQARTLAIKDDLVRLRDEAGI